MLLTDHAEILLRCFLAKLKSYPLTSSEVSRGFSRSLREELMLRSCRAPGMLHDGLIFVAFLRSNRVIQLLLEEIDLHPKF